MCPCVCERDLLVLWVEVLLICSVIDDQVVLLFLLQSNKISSVVINKQVRYVLAFEIQSHVVSHVIGISQSM